MVVIQDDTVKLIFNKLQLFKLLKLTNFEKRKCTTKYIGTFFWFSQLDIHADIALVGILRDNANGNGPPKTNKQNLSKFSTEVLTHLKNNG